MTKHVFPLESDTHTHTLLLMYSWRTEKEIALALIG